jgi:signal transduction histidine kinase
VVDAIDNGTAAVNVLRALHLVCIATYGGLASYVMWRAPGLRRGIAFAVLAACFAVWSAALLLAHDPTAPWTVARTAYDLTAVGWASFAPACFWFALAFAGRRLSSRWHAVAITAPAAVFMVQQWRGVIADGYVRTAWGWAYDPSDSPWTYAYYAYYTIVVGLALVVMLDYRKRSTDRHARRQAAIVVLMALPPFVAASLTDITLPRLGYHAIPNIAPAFLLVWMAGVAIAIVRYRFLQITPENAAGEILASMADGVLLVDLDGRVARANAAATELLAPRVPVPGAALAELATPAEVAEGMIVTAVPDGERIVSVTVSGVHDRNGAAVGSICLLRDVTARELVARSLREARDELEDRVKERTRELDVAYDELERFSRTLGAMLAAFDAIHKGGTLAEVGKTVANAIPRGLARDNARGCRVVIDDDVHESDGFVASDSVATAEVSAAGKTRGRIEIHLASVGALLAEEARMLQAIAIELGQSIDGIALRQALAQSERLASMGLLAAGVAHEINNPLAYVIAGLSEIQQQAGRTDVDRALVRERADEALDGARRIARIVRDLGSFARARDEHLVIDVGGPIEAAIAIARNQLRHRTSLLVEPGEPASVRADPGRLTQVVLNLLINALHALTGRENAEVGVSWSATDTEVRIAVRDNGVGIAPDDLAQVFDPFFTRKRLGQGSGLGLAISHGIVTAAGGRIEVTSELGVGTRFTIVLPRAPDAEGGQTPPPPAPPAADAAFVTGERIRVLVVDDEPMVGRALGRILAECACTTVDSAAAAKELLRTDAFDVVISDIMMPDTTGAELFEWIEREAPRYVDRVVFMTGGTFTGETDVLAARMGERMIGKPFDRDEVLRLVRACAGRTPA